MKKVITLFLIGIALALNGCTTTHPKIESNNAKFILTIEGKPVPFDMVTSDKNLTDFSENVDQDIIVNLLLVQDGFYGTPHNKNLIVENNSNIVLDEALFKKIAKPKKMNNANHAGLTITPESTRVARLATLCEIRDKENKGTQQRHCGLLDKETKEKIMIVYFDSPCEITGTHKSKVKQRAYDIKIMKPGFHFIRLSDTVSITEAPEKGYLVIVD